MENPGAPVVPQKPRKTHRREPRVIDVATPLYRVSTSLTLIYSILNSLHSKNNHGVRGLRNMHIEKVNS